MVKLRYLVLHDYGLEADLFKALLPEFLSEFYLTNSTLSKNN